MALFEPNILLMQLKHDVKGLLKALRYRRKDVIREATNALVYIGAEAQAVAALIAGLGDSEPSRRASAAKMLGEIRDASAIVPLFSALAHPDRQVQSYALVALDKIGDLGEARPVEPVIAALKNPAPGARVSATRILARLDDARAVQPLIAALKDGDGYVREAALLALLRIGRDPKMVPPSARLRKSWSGPAGDIARKELTTEVASLIEHALHRLRGPIFLDTFYPMMGFGGVAVGSVLRTLIRRCRESAEQFRKTGRDDLSTREQAKVAIMESYLPATVGGAAPYEAEEIDNTSSRALKEAEDIEAAIYRVVELHSDLFCLGRWSPNTYDTAIKLTMKELAGKNVDPFRVSRRVTDHLSYLEEKERRDRQQQRRELGIF